MNIKKTTGEIISVINLSKTAKDIKIKLLDPIDFIAGSFVNVFIDINGEKVRRAYSISSSSCIKDTINLTIRLSPEGTMTPFFWNNNMIGRTVELMGPLGLNTVDKMKQNKIYLFGFGVGAGVVKSIADYFSKIKTIENITIITGNRTEDEILYKDYFDKLVKDFKNISVTYVVSRIHDGAKIPNGYIQDHIDGFDFNNSDVYICGGEASCNDLTNKIKSMNHDNCNFFIESFH